MKTVRIITIGDELLSGFTVDTNSNFIAREFFQAGYLVIGIESVGDEAANILATLKTAAALADIVIVTGGLGPTHDDITKKTAADFFKTDLIFSQPIWEEIVKRFSNKTRKISDSNRCQAEIIRGSKVISNKLGTAPCLHLVKNKTDFYFLPGVPGEMRCLLTEEIIPELIKRNELIPPEVLVLRTIGIPESTLFDQIKDCIHKFPSVKLAFLPQMPGVDIRLTAMESENVRSDREQLHHAAEYISAKIGSVIFARGDITLTEVVASILVKSSLKIALAESCTGGLIANMFTNIPGSSNWFERGFVTYSNEAKIENLLVNPDIIKQHGAVSEATAKAMAKGVLNVSRADVGLAITGIAGPGPGTETKPVGLVYIAFADKSGVYAERHTFFKQRLQNKQRFAFTAIDLVRRRLDNPDR